MFKEFLLWTKHSKAAWIFAAVAFALCIGYYMLEVANGRAQMADFRVYYDAAKALINNTQLYGVAFGISSGFYKYSPFAALVFVPFALLPYSIASVLYYLLVSVGAIYLLLFIAFFFNSFQTHIGKFVNSKLVLFIVLLTIFMADHLERELHLGNVNLFLLILAIACYMNLAKRPWVAGLVYAVILLFKPHFLILFPYFVWKGQWKVLAGTLAGVAIGILLPSLFVGLEHNFALHQQWLGAMKAHNVSLTESANTIYGIFTHFILQVSQSNVLIIGSLFLIALGFLWLMRYNKLSGGKGHIWFIEFFILLALIPNLTHTDTEHFMWSMPLVAFNLFMIVNEQFRGKWIVAIGMFLAFIPYTLNSPDIVGKQIRFLFDEGGLLGIANLMIILLAIYIHLNIRNKEMRFMKL